MSETEGTASVLEETPSSTPSVLTINVMRHGGHKKKELKFTVVDFDLVDKQHIYNIRHVVGLEQGVSDVSIYGRNGDVFVTLRDWQLVTEELAEKLAQSIGNALNFPLGHVTIKIGKLQ